MKVYLTLGQYVRLQNIANEYWNMHTNAYYIMSKSEKMYNKFKKNNNTELSWLSDDVNKYKALSDSYWEKCMNIRALDVIEVK
jgi:prolyl oligopeptidase PreP (S9A serine peptidase family)